MSDGQSPVTMPEGITPAAPDQGITTATPEASTGQATGQISPDTGQATAPQTDEPTFFDPSTLPPELMPGYKQMQAAFTKKMQGLSGDKAKIEAYNQFMADPVGQMQQMARQMGYSLTRAEAAAAINQQGQAQAQNWEPQSWDEVIQRTKQAARDEIMQELQPFLGNVQKVTAQTIERQLSEIDPNWRTYEDDMREKLQRHPTLVNDVTELYRLSVPEEVLTSRAVQTALAKFQSKAEQVKVGGTTKTSRTEPAMPDIRKMKSGDAFQVAVEIARKKLALGG
jgi:hypothetical protein